MDARESLAAIVQRLEAIEKVFANYSAAIRAKEEGDRENIQRLRAEITFDDASKQEGQTEADRQNRTQEKIGRYAFYAFLAAIIYAGISALQLYEMRIQTAQVFHQSEVENANASGENAQLFRQLNILERQTEATHESAMASGDQSRSLIQQLALQRELAREDRGGAILTVKAFSVYHSDIEKGVGIGMQIQNEGMKSRAGDIAIAVDFGFRNSTPTPKEYRRKGFKLAFGSSPLPPNNIGSISYNDIIKKKFPPNKYAIYKNGAIEFYVWGLIRHTEFGGELVYDKSFCEHVSARVIFEQPPGFSEQDYSLDTWARFQ